MVLSGPRLWSANTFLRIGETATGIPQVKLVVVAVVDEGARRYVKALFFGAKTSRHVATGYSRRS